jgi:hypothetical protein
MVWACGWPHYGVMRIIRFSLLASVCVVCGFSQSLAEHAAAAAGASVGGAAGKPVSDAITRIFGNVDKTTAKATSAPAAAAPVAPARSVAPDLPATPAAGVAPAPQANPAPKVLRAATVQPVPAVAAPETPAPAPTIGQPTADDLRAVTNGTPRGELMARLGLPSSRITIPDDSGLLEIYRYSGADGLVGSVRLENGLVVAVQVAAR